MSWVDDLVDWPPFIFHSSFSEKEAESASHLSFLISQLSSYINNYEKAKKLFDHCETLPTENAEIPPFQWQIIAAESATLNIYHFGSILGGIHDLAKQCPSIWPHIDEPQLKSARSKFDKYFNGKGATRARHAVAHSADITRTPKELKKHSLANNGGSVFLSSNLRGRQLVMTWEGVELSVDISDETIGHLVEIKKIVYAAFKPVALHLSSLT